MSPSERLRPGERRTLGLTVAYLGSLAVVYAVDDSRLWLLWAVAAAGLAGATLVYANRSASGERSEGGHAREESDGDADSCSGSESGSDRR